MTNVSPIRSQKTNFMISQHHKKQTNSFFGRIFTISFFGALIAQAHQNLFVSENRNSLFPHVTQIKNPFTSVCESGYQKMTPDLSSFMYTGVMLAKVSFTYKNMKYKRGWMGCIIKEDLLTETNCSIKAMRIINRSILNEFAAKQANLLGNSIFDPNKDWLLNSGTRMGNDGSGRELQVGMDYLKYQNHLRACSYLGDIFLTNVFFEKDETEILEVFNEVHRLLTQNLRYNEEQGATPGKLRTVVSYVHSLHNPQILDYKPKPDKVLALMLNFIKNFKQHILNKSNPIELAAWVHCSLVGIHPYVGSNGKAARLWMNAVLARGGYQPIIFPNTTTYNEAVVRDLIEQGHFAKFLIEDVIPWNKKNVKPPIEFAIC